MSSDSLLRMTVPVLEDEATATIVVPRHGIPVPHPATGLFYALTGGECKRPYQSELQWLASRTGKKVATVEIDVARPKDANVPEGNHRGIRGRRLLHTRYMKVADRHELGRLWEKKAAKFSTGAVDDVDWEDVLDFPVAYPQVVASIFKSLKDLEVLVIPMRTILMNDENWIAVARTSQLPSLARRVHTLISSRRIVLPGA